MKKLIIKLIKLYQSTPLHCHSSCRFIPTCSNYAIEAFERHGLLKGFYLSLKRIIRCHPGGKKGIDLVPTKK